MLQRCLFAVNPEHVQISLLDCDLIGIQKLSELLIDLLTARWMHCQNEAILEDKNFNWSYQLVSVIFEVNCSVNDLVLAKKIRF